ncbi:ATP-binding protein [Parendozoicomonas haliclonae]|uniref:histidine kinase n=1 Tax=Parendozoicomonas haliclonae TaxID=1960125 RepID=A0A1X7AI65_9GAMM|nr:ATP-binding protein [Parendozoicomonas haliclonae]SMA38130.1 Osmolarity sensor protein EnvZ [Parendozoicomonas haliclonae]
MRKFSLRRIPLLPRSMTAQMVLVVLLALLVAQIITAIILFDAHKANFYHSAQGQAIQRTVLLAQKLSKSPAILHGAMVDAASTPLSRYSITLRPVLKDRGSFHEWRGGISRRIEKFLGPGFHDKVRIQITTHERRKTWDEVCTINPLTNEESCRPIPRKRGNEQDTEFTAMSIQLPDKTWLNLVAEAPAMEPLAARQTIIFLIVASGLVLVAMTIMVRRITRPLRAMSIASNRLGRGEDVEPLPEEGPDDVRRATRAFNRMNLRLKRFVEDRTNMLAAITHDLRTPITTLRLRVELLDDSVEQQQLLATLDEMQHMVEATLTFARENADKEPSKKVNLDALLDSTCEDLVEIGLDVSYEEGPDIVTICRPLSLRRALRNLIENAVKYGQRAHVSLGRDSQNILITIDDDGPGMDEKDMDRVFEPFVRLEDSRCRETGGIGLGMAIARNIIHAHGGDIALSNREEGGLRITISLPA